MKDKDRNSKSEGIDELIDRLLKAYQLDGKMKEYDIISGWEEMMGKAVAMRTDKIFIRERVLYLRLNSSVMREELINGKEVIIQRVNQFAGEKIIDDIWFE